MTGEYKVPGGKLVVADLVVGDGVIEKATISGDFFLEPDDALERMDAALAGAPVGASTAELSARVAGALDGAVPLGFSADAVATAVRRAVTGATTWTDHDWRFLRGEPYEPAVQMALDEVLAQQVGAGERPPTLRVWEWASNAVIIGSFQSVRNEVDLDAAARHDVSVVRRISGGGAMFVEPGNTITYSLYVPESLVSGLSFVDSYAFLDDWVVGALNELGVEATYQPINDITSPAGKIAGAAQKRLAGGVVLHHVTMAYDIDADKMLDVLRIGREKVSDKGTKSANKRVDPVRRQTGLARADVIDRLVGSFRSRHGLTDEQLDARTLELARERVETKFGTEEWLHRVP
ncbi:lipoate--protein ligase family protein [Actinobacteria bacterium YIM 96077]|uniref:Lipoate--protein ligase family protein n=1 Tax=Phytoactinopolyspora halophila TaxID=1981511 RepID=A0A329QJT1_9ACTN|nr:lipoate--protein ligase family protein [Actinobacteria bacterium YIM 96077]RAW12584.1 lipoate--protein ligase family protein [Phytoactinopolyspora halophila]